MVYSNLTIKYGIMQTAFSEGFVKENNGNMEVGFKRSYQIRLALDDRRSIVALLQ